MANLSSNIRGEIGGNVVVSGSYTPSSTVITGTTTITEHVHYWSRVGNNVTVFGRLTSTNPSASDVVVTITLPVITAAFGSGTDASGNGTAIYETAPEQKHVIWIRARTGEPRVEIWHEGSSADTPYEWHYTFMYEIQP